jgi:outer membrane protein assembly factor BamB
VPEKGDPALKLGMYGDVVSVEGEPPQSFRLYCLDRRSGKILWERTAASGPPKSKRHPKSSHANPTPATDGRHVAAFFGSEGLYVYDFNGRLLWKKDLGVLEASFYVMPEAQWGFASSPVIADGKLIILADVLKNGFLAAFDVRTGNPLWRVPRGDVPGFGSPTVAPYSGRDGAGRQIVVNGWKHIGGYDLETGKELWRMKGGGDIPTPTPVFSDGLVVITNAHGQGRPIYAVRTNAAGDITDRREAVAWVQERAGNYMPTPLLHDGLAYFCNDIGVLTVYALAGGERVYQQRLGEGRVGIQRFASGRGWTVVRHRRGRPDVRPGARARIPSPGRERTGRERDGIGGSIGWRAVHPREASPVRHRVQVADVHQP